MTKYFLIVTEGKYKPDKKIVDDGFPFVWGDRIADRSNSATIKTLSTFFDISKGDIIVTGSMSMMNRIGIAKDKSLFVKSTEDSGYVNRYKFKDADTSIENLFAGKENIFSDTIGVPVDWIWYGSENIHSLGQGTMCRINPDRTDIRNSINIKINSYNNNKMENQVKHLLLANHNVILTGAPGTGKTYTAQNVAEEMIKATSAKSDAMSILKNAIADFKIDEEYREEQIKLITNFHKKFPIDRLDALSLDEYCAGKGDKDNFCWWIERGLVSLGRYAPGSARSYLIFYKKEIDDYSIHWYIKTKQEENPNLKNDDLLKILLTDIKEVVQNKDFIKGHTQIMGTSLLLKILNSYYPEEYFPINSKKYIDNVLNLFNIVCSGDYETKNKAIMTFCKEKTNGKDITPFEFMKILCDNFNIKDGELINNDSTIITKGEYKFVQFHPAYTYEDFVRGIVAKSTDEKISYEVENKILGNFAQTAKDNPNKNYVLIIDEINRANLSAVLGELIYALEYRDKEIETIYELDGDNSLVIPKNLYIIGTMNTADRSAGQIDYAIRRRFAFESILPKVLEDSELDGKRFAKELFENVSTLFVKTISTDIDEVDKKENRSAHLSEEFKPSDVWVGHSYFITDNEKTIEHRLKYEIKPLLREYLKDGILKESAIEIINNLDK